MGCLGRLEYKSIFPKHPERMFGKYRKFIDLLVRNARIVDYIYILLKQNNLLIYTMSPAKSSTYGSQ